MKDLLISKGYIRGPFGSALKRNEMKNEGIAVYEQQNAIYDNRTFRYYIDSDKFEKLKRFKVNTGDLIVSCSGTVGKISIISENDKKGIISQALLILRVNKNIIYPEFLKYFLETQKGYHSLTATSGGSSQINIAKKDIILNISLKIPNLDEQKHIISFLDIVNHKIELLEQTLSLYNKTIRHDIDYIYSSLDYSAIKLNKIFENHASNLSLNNLEDNSGEYVLYGADGIVKKIDFYDVDKPYIAIIKDGAGVGKLNLCKSYSSALGTLQCLIPDEDYDINFLYYYLKSLNFNKYVVGSTIPHIYFKDYSKEKLKIPPINIQSKIGDYFYKKNIKKENIENEIKNYKLFKKGLLQRMFC